MQKNSNSPKFTFYQAFTMAEIVLVIGIFVIVVAVALPLGLGQLDRENQNSLVTQIESAIFTQQQDAFAGKGTGNFGVYFGTDSYTIYEGLSLATAVWSETIELTRGAVIVSVDLSTSSRELLFTSQSLSPLGYGTVEIDDLQRRYIVEINQEGAIDNTIIVK